MIDIRQQRCAHDGCIAWRLSRPGTCGQSWRPGWLRDDGRPDRRGPRLTVSQPTLFDSLTDWLGGVVAVRHRQAAARGVR